MIIDTGKIFNDKKVGYSIENNGYTIYLDEKPWITQPDPYGKLYVPDGSYEDNALAQIEEIVNPPEPEPTAEDRLRADVDYIAAMTGVNLQKGDDETWH